MIVQPEVITKKQLQLISGNSARYFTNFLSIRYKDIKRIDKTYNKNCSILTPKIADYILDELGITREEARTAYREMLKRHESDLTIIPHNR